MPFAKGMSGNPKGRKTGTLNTLTRDLRARVQSVVEGQLDRMLEDLEALEPKDRVNAWLKLTEFVLPKLQRSETVIDLSNLSDPEIDALFERAMSKQTAE